MVRYLLYGSQICNVHGRDVYTELSRQIDDIVQDAFLHCWRQVIRFDESKSSFASWRFLIIRHYLARVITNTINRQKRKEAFDEQYRYELTKPQRYDIDYSETAKAEVEKIINTFSAPRRSILRLWAAGMKQRDIARLKNISRANANIKITNALKRLRILLREVDPYA